LQRWRRLTLLAQGTQPPMMLLEDAEDIAEFLLATGRAVQPSRWAEEVIAAKNAEQIEALF
jgi:hypothetical protein